MRCLWPRRSLLLAVLVTLAAPAVATSQGPARLPASGYPGDPEWQTIINEQEAARTCKSREPGRLVVRHPPIPEDYQPTAADPRVACTVQSVIAALREGQPVELENVVLKGPLEFRAVSESTAQGDLPFAPGTQQAAFLQAWLDERRRDQRAPDLLARDTEFRPVVPPIAIRNSWIESIDASAVDPVLFLDAVDFRGSRIGGLVNVAGAVFRGPVTFEAAHLLGRASFTRAHFDAGLDLSRAQLERAARFDGVTFGTRALSRRPDRRWLTETAALFTGTTFAGSVSFRDAVFEPRADFQKALFRGDADFGAARFEQLADFGHAHFAAPLDASQAIFGTEARFPNVAFDKPASFRRTEFRWRADFGLASFADPGTTFREARFGPSLQRLWRRGAGDQESSPRLTESGYDFRHARFADRDRALARSEFEIHEVFAVAILALAGLGLLVCLKFQRRPQLVWQQASDDVPEVATVTAAPANTGVLVSPRQRVIDGAVLLAAYAVLAVGLAVHYQNNAEVAVDLWVGVVYPVAAAIVWVAAVYATVVAFEFRARRLRAARRRSERPPQLDYFDLTYHVPRRCDEFVTRFVTRVSTGVLGLVGAPGAGRSSLARAVMEQLSEPSAAEGEGPDSPGPILAVTTPSPASSDLLPFFTVLFRRANNAARADLRRRLFRLERGRQLEDVAGELIEPPPRIVFLPTVAVLAAMALFVARPWRPPIHSGDAADAGVAALLRLAADTAPILLLGIVVLSAAVYYWRLKRRTDLRRALNRRPTGLLYVATERVLERLAFEQSLSDESEGSLALPYGVGLRRRQGRALRERPLTLPVMLDDFRHYVEELRTVYPRGVVVHVDDADRIDDPKNIRDLLLRIKATLVGGVLYLVPLPDTVLEGTGLGVAGSAGVVASLLDDLVFVAAMTTIEGLRMLARRQLFPPSTDPHVGGVVSRDGLGLAICLVAGGMPKEILRLLRRVGAEPDEWTAGRVLDETWREACDSAEDAIRRSDLPDDGQRRLGAALQTFLAGAGDEAAATALIDSVPAGPAAPGEAAGTRAAIAQMLRRLVQRRRATDEIRGCLEELSTLERELVADKRLFAQTPWTAPERVERIRRAFLRESTVFVAEGAR